MSALLRRVEAGALPRTRPVVDEDVLARAAGIVERVRREGEPALRELCERHDGLAPGAELVLGPAVLDAAWDALDDEPRALLDRTVARVRRFAEAQRAALAETRLPVPGGVVGHTLHAVRSAGCYAPGGRHPLPSSVVMTVVPARVAGVERVVVASPCADRVTLAAARAAGADAFLVAGGAQAVAALAHGVAVEPVDVIAGPGNAWVTAAKKLVVGTVGIDMLAGPSELVVLADADASPARVAADLLAQAEHDVEALPVLVTTSEATLAAVERELARQLADLPTADVARAALARGFAVLAADLDEAVAACNRIAPEHLSIAVGASGTAAEAEVLAARLTECGAAFVGGAAAEALGDYGVGPNHVLPTGGGARFGAGLSVATFLRARTFVRIDDERAAAELVRDAARLARLEGLEAHARSAEARLAPGSLPTLRPDPVRLGAATH